MSVLFRKKQWLTLAQLTGAWGLELANAGEGDRYIQDLEDILLTDIINGRLDDSGPLTEDQRSGLRLITPENKAGIIKGHHVRDLLRTSPISWASNHIVVMKEAALDFAGRHELPPPDNRRHFRLVSSGGAGLFWCYVRSGAAAGSISGRIASRALRAVSRLTPYRFARFFSGPEWRLAEYPPA